MNRMWKGKAQFLRFQMAELDSDVLARFCYPEKRDDCLAHFQQVWDSVYAAKHREQVQIAWNTRCIERATAKASGQSRAARL